MTVAVPTIPCTYRSGCHHPGIWVRADTLASFVGEADPAAADAMAPEAFYCGIHTRVENRYRVDPVRWIPIKDPSVEVLIRAAVRERKRLDNEAAAIRTVKVDEVRQRQLDRITEEWAELAVEPVWRTRYVERPGGLLSREERLFAIEQVVEAPADADPDAVEHFAQYPREYVSLSYTSAPPAALEPVYLKFGVVRSPFTPKQARAIAEALNRAADMADSMNAGRRADRSRRGIA